MRHWHRWAAIPSGILLFFVAVTGVLLHLDLIRVGHQPPGHDLPDPRPPHPLPSDAELAAIVTRAADTIRATPGPAPRMLRIDLVGPRITVSASSGSPEGLVLMIDGASGRPMVQPRPRADYHFFLKDLHAGYRWGWTGRVISILTGIAVIVLSITGVKLWWDMRRRGGKGIYWK